MALLLNVQYGTLSIVAFIGPWILYALAWPGLAADALLRTRLPWAFPLLAMTSAGWSAAPDLTIRNAAEWLLTVGIALLMTRALPARRVICAWMFALLPIVIIGGVLGKTQYTETGELAVTGLFGSKNNFALHICLMMFVCVAVAGDAGQKTLHRIIGLAGFAAGLLLIWKAKSVGALAVFFPSLLLMCGITALGRIGPRLRQIALVGSLLVLVTGGAILVPIALSSKDALLSTVGKSGDLTGRGYLWYRAAFLIQQRPTLGVGYQAFWVQGNLEAEGLWRAEHIASRGGFHFHSFYYETLVELGYLGLFVGGMSFVLTSFAVLAWGLRWPGPESGFFAAVMLFFFMRSFVELDLEGGFDITTLAIPAGWFYATEVLGRSRVRVPSRPSAPMPADLAMRPWGLG